MPSEFMDKRRVSPLYDSSAPFLGESQFETERHVGFWKSELVPDCRDGIKLTPESKSADPKHRAMGVDSGRNFELHQASLLKSQKTESSFKHLTGAEGTTAPLKTTWDSSLNDKLLPSSLYPKESKVNLNGVHFENALFSSSLSEMFTRNVTLSANGDLRGNEIHTSNCNNEEEEIFESMEEIEAQTIGDLLPDDDDLLSGVIDNLECASRAHNNIDVEDDLFSSVGGMEIEEVNSSGLKRDSELANGAGYHQLGELNNALVGGHPYGQHPSRTLFVRNINSNIEDAELRDLFKQYGDIQTLYTACKHRGFVMISYYDIRSALSAMRELQNKPLRLRKLDINFSIPKDDPSEKDINQGILVVRNLEGAVSNEKLHQLFGLYGEIKEICENPHKPHQKYIVFYDIRAAEVALHALQSSDISGNIINLEPGCIEDLQCSLTQQRSSELEHDEIREHSNSSLQGHRGTLPIGPVTRNDLDYGAILGQTVSRVPISWHMDNTFNGVSSSVPHSLSSPVRSSLTNNSNQSGPSMLSHSFGQVNFGFQCMPNFHPHSLPERRDGMPYNSSNPISGIPTTIARSTVPVDSRHVALGLTGFSGPNFERTERGNGSYPVRGHQHVWNNSNSFCSPPGPVMWPNSPSFANNIPYHPSSQLHGIPRSPSHMINNTPITPVPNHHVGSAPTLNPSIWDRRQSFAGEPTESSAFHPGSLGTRGFSANSTLNPMDIAQGNMFPNINGSFVEPAISSLHVGLPSPQQRGHMFNCRNGMLTMPGMYGSPNDRIRSRKNDVNSNQADKRQFELDIERIVSGEDGRTTLMIKNIPNKYTSKMLLAAIDEHHRGSYDFIYLPIDFKNKCNVGYAFINMVDCQQIIPFYKEFNGKKWEKFNSEKVASLAYARIQGKAGLVAHFQNSSLMNEDKRCRPILFHSAGPNAGDQEPFPVGSNIRSRVGRSRNHDNDIQDSLSISAKEEASKETMTSSGLTKEFE